MAEGKIVEYIDQKRFVLSVCLKDKLNKLQLLTSSNHEVSISPKRAFLVSSNFLNISKPRDELLRELKNIEQRRIEYMEKVSVHDLWELTQEENEIFPFQYLAQLAFGDYITDDHISALVRALFSDRVYFKLQDNSFIPHSPRKVEQIQKAREAAELRESQIIEGADFLRGVINGRIPENPTRNKKIIEVLIQLALYGNDAPDFKLGREIFSRAGIKDINQAYRLLVKLNVWDEDENLDLYRYKTKIDFSKLVLQEASAIIRKEVDTSVRENLTGLSIFTIDGAYTRDFDDALSLEPLKKGYRLGVHITDVAPFIEPDSFLDGEASARASSIYLPVHQIPMFPPELSNNSLSLLKDHERLALSLMADFDGDWNLTQYRFSHTILRVEKQLTYDEVNTEYTHEPIFLALYRLTQTLRQKRAANGAMMIPLPEIHFEIDNSSTIRVKLVEQDTPARIMISECMILYNCLAAKFASENGIPILYRSQEPPQERLPINEYNYIYYVFQQRRKLQPLSIDTIPRPHHGIGVDAYTNVTSPIRRYLDLLVQRQIHSGISNGNPLYTESRLKELSMSIQQTLKDIGVMNRNQTRYWILKYLRGRIHDSLAAIVFQKLKSKYLIILTDLLFVAELPLMNSHELSPGEEIKVVVKKSDPRDDALILELVY
jgi:exoribonuclease-2